MASLLFHVGLDQKNKIGRALGETTNPKVESAAHEFDHALANLIRLMHPNPFADGRDQ
jgi:hypothetical protein